MVIFRVGRLIGARDRGLSVLYAHGDVLIPRSAVNEQSQLAVGQRCAGDRSLKTHERADGALVIQHREGFFGRHAVPLANAAELFGISGQEGRQIDGELAASHSVEQRNGELGNAALVGNDELAHVLAVHDGISGAHIVSHAVPYRRAPRGEDIVKSFALSYAVERQSF